MRRAGLAYLVVGLYILTVTSGCISSMDEDGNSDTEVSYPSIWDRHSLEWQTNHTFSFLLEPGPFYPLDVQEAFIEVDTSEVWEVGPSVSSCLLYTSPSPRDQRGSRMPACA